MKIVFKYLWSTCYHTKLYCGNCPVKLSLQRLTLHKILSLPSPYRLMLFKWTINILFLFHCLTVQKCRTEVASKYSYPRSVHIKLFFNLSQGLLLEACLVCNSCLFVNTTFCRPVMNVGLNNELKVRLSKHNVKEIICLAFTVQLQKEWKTSIDSILNKMYCFNFLAGNKSF